MAVYEDMWTCGSQCTWKEEEDYWWILFLKNTKYSEKFGLFPLQCNYNIMFLYILIFDEYHARMVYHFCLMWLNKQHSSMCLFWLGGCIKYTHLSAPRSRVSILIVAGIILQLTLSSKLTQSKHYAREFRGDNTVSVILTTSLVEFQMG